MKRISAQFLRGIFVFALSLSLFTHANAQNVADVERRAVDIMSEGTRMSATVFIRADNKEEKLPTILMAHGWGGTAAVLIRDAMAFARAGYMVVTFDYRGWGQSDSRVILTSSQKADNKEGTFTAKVREVREIVDPVDMTTDWLNAIHWLHGEPRVDKDRIGLWGSSQSGGYVIWAAAHDPRIRAVHSQVGAMSGHGMGDTPEAIQQAIDMARGELGYPKAGEVVVGNLRGAPILSRFANYHPVDQMHLIKDVAIQFVLAEKEELFDNKDHGILAHERYTGGPKNLVIIPDILHYGIYREAWQQTSDLAISWFDKHLK